MSKKTGGEGKGFYQCSFCGKDVLSHEIVWKYMKGWSKTPFYNHFVERIDLGLCSCEECFPKIKKGEIDLGNYDSD